MTRALRRILVWALILFFSQVLNIILEQPQNFLAQISPISVLRLDLDIALALAVTFCASLSAWIIAVIIGHTLGSVAAATAVSGQKNNYLSGAGKTLNQVIEWGYLVPFVLTVSLTYALAYHVVSTQQMPQQIIFVVMVAVAGLALGGYHIFKSIYDAASGAKQEDLQLAGSLYSRGKRQLFYAWSLAKRLRDCRIHSYCSALKSAFHLSIVSIMIVEAVTPRFYELVWPSSGPVETWTLGAGRLILTAQNNYQYEVIAGCIWIVLLFDSMMVTLLDAYFHRRWLKFYKEEP